MEENKIFGSNVTLPSLPGLQSDCEEEILLLMKEVDSVFEQKHGELLNELKYVRSQCQSQRDEIENLRGLLMPNHQAIQDNKVAESSKDYYPELQKLRKENNELKTENFSLQRQLKRLPESEIFQLDSLKRNLTTQQDENRALKERLLKVNQQYETLRNSYQRLVNTLAAHRQGNIKSTSNNVGESSSDLVKAQVTQIEENIISEETKHYNDFQFKINKEIDDLERRLQKEKI